MDEMLALFKEESTSLISELIELLEEIEGDPKQHQRLEQYGQIVDRIMGVSKTISLSVQNSTLTQIAVYADLCKVLGYQGSQISNNDSFYTTVVAFLFDATEMLENMTNALGTSEEKNLKEFLSSTFLDRLKWISSQFPKNIRTTVGVEGAPADAKIQNILKTLGVPS
ncbi:MAG: hypothetical protein ABL927_08805 [Bdellovibrionales bacterium]